MGCTQQPHTAAWRREGNREGKALQLEAVQLVPEIWLLPSDVQTPAVLAASANCSHPGFWVSLSITSSLPKGPPVLLFSGVSRNGLLQGVRKEQWFLVVSEPCKRALEKKVGSR